MTVWRTGLTACYCKETSSLNMDLIDKPHRPAPRSLPISTEKDKKPIFLSLKVVDTVEGLIFLINAVDDFVPPNNQFPSVTRKNQGRIEETIQFFFDIIQQSIWTWDYSLFREVSENVRKVFGKLLLLTRLKGGSCMQRSSVRGDCLFCTLHLSIEKALRWKGDPRTHSIRIL